MRGGYAVRPVWVVVPIVLILVVVSVLVVQRNQNTIPRSTGGRAATDSLTSWAGAAAARDYAAAERYMIQDNLLYTFWKDSHDNFADDIVGYRIISKETVGQTTTALVAFDRTDAAPRCIEVMVDEVTQQVRVDQPYGPCPAQPSATG